MTTTAGTGVARTGRRAPVSGPREWRDGWSYWDLWYAVVCVADYGGDLDALDAAIVAAHPVAHRGNDAEAKWSHLCDLRQRLSAAGLAPTDLAGPMVADKAVLRRAREKVTRSTLRDQDLTAAMRDRPSVRLRQRSLRGWWPRFPVSPERAYARLAAMTGHSETFWGSQASARLAGEIAAAVATSLAQTGDGPSQIAVRRAALTVVSEASDHANDSFGELGRVSGQLLSDYAGSAWRSAGLAPEVFWTDLFDLICVDPYLLAFERETGVLATAGAATDLDLIEATLDRLAGGYTRGRLRHEAEAAQRMRVYATVAAAALGRFVAAARRIGSAHWRPIDAMVEFAVAHRRLDLARAVLDAADQPGPQRDWVRRRRAALGHTGSPVRS